MLGRELRATALLHEFPRASLTAGAMALGPSPGPSCPLPPMPPHRLLPSRLPDPHSLSVSASNSSRIRWNSSVALIALSGALRDCARCPKLMGSGTGMKSLPVPEAASRGALGVCPWGSQWMQRMFWARHAEQGPGLEGGVQRSEDQGLRLLVLLL